MNDTEPNAMIELATGERLYYGGPIHSKTPETDAARVSVDTYAGEYLVDADPRGRWVEATFAEKLERERDEARLQRDQARREAEASQDCK